MTVYRRPCPWRALGGLVMVAEGLVYALTWATVRPDWSFAYMCWLVNHECKEDR